MNNKKEKSANADLKLAANPIDLSARFLAARPDFVGAWIIGAHGILPIFKSAHKEAVIGFLDTVQTEFFAALKHHFEKKHPDQKMTYTFGTICRNRRGDERLVIGILPQESGKPSYEYMGDDGKVGACNESSMSSWMDKN